ncbi:unnamed protein product [Colias eurytheme]|nr:unnamed protein product [Colias eurytheme]
MDSAYILGCCSVKDDNENFVVCIKCKEAFHFKCLNLSPNLSDVKEWHCPKCAGKRSTQDHTPIRTSRKEGTLYSICSREDNITKRSNKRQALSSPPDGTTEVVTKEEVVDIIRETIRTEMQSILAQVKTSISSEMKTIKTEIVDLKNSMEFINKQYEDFKKEHHSALKSLDQLLNENTNMRSTITHLNERLNQLEQNSRSNNVEIQCVPEKKTENLLSIVSSIGKVVKCNVEEESIVKCTRTAKLDPTSARPRAIIVQFNTPRLRDQFLAATKIHNRAQKEMSDKLNTGDIGLAGEKKPIFVMEHLSPTNKALHAAARQKAKQHNYKFVWVRGGKIFVRKAENTDFVYIKDMNSLDKIK